MNLLHFILLVLLGLLALSAGAVPHQMTDVTADNTLPDLGRTVGKDLAARQGYPSALLLRWDLKCGSDPKTPFAPYLEGKYLTASYCKNWFDCKPDGTKVTKPFPFDPCEEWCKCDIMDEPQQHYAANFGCPNPAGKQIHGSFGSVSRDAGSDGLVMEAYDGPPRKE